LCKQQVHFRDKNKDGTYTHPDRYMAQKYDQALEQNKRDTSMKQMNLAHYLMIILVLCFIGCESKQQENTNISNQKIDKDVLEQVDEFATYEGEAAQEAWNKLSSHSREDLLASLQRLQNREPKDEILRVHIAFVLCNLNYEYNTNRQIITTAFNTSFDYADRFQGIIARLIDKGDEDLLPVLFAVAPKSDGCLSEGLGSTFATQMQKNPEQFLSKLNSQPQVVKQHVYMLMELGMSEEEYDKIKSKWINKVKK
jgi:hypothetical protein